MESLAQDLAREEAMAPCAVFCTGPNSITGARPLFSRSCRLPRRAVSITLSCAHVTDLASVTDGRVHEARVSDDAGVTVRRSW